MRFNELENPTVAILGTGREGQAVWRQLRKRYPDKPLGLFSESGIDEVFKQETNRAVDHVHTGAFDVAKLGGYDVLVRSAGISPYREDLQQLRAGGIRITTASNIWFAENPNARTICISGTLGKSTTASLTAHLLKQAGLDVCLAGNIGRPMLDIAGSPDWWVIELSSYQLCDLEAEISIAVLLNVSEEHLDWHGGLKRYQADKLRLARMASQGHVIANYADEVLTAAIEGLENVTWFNHEEGWLANRNSVFQNINSLFGAEGVGPETTGNKTIRIDAPPSLPGQHNMQNLAAALTVMDILGLSRKSLKKSLSTFTGLPHRLQLLGTRSGVRYVNDSISTTPVSVSAALETLGHRGLVLLLGGFDRGLDWQHFAVGLKGTVPHAIITLPDNGPNIMACLRRADIKPEGGMHGETSLGQALDTARKLVPKGGCILLSPGAPSFPHFRDFEDRGEQFRQLAGF